MRLVSLVCSVLAFSGCAPATSSDVRAPAAASAPGSARSVEERVAVGQTTFDVADATRPALDHDGPRPVASTVWYPAVAGAPEAPIVIGPPGRPLFSAGHAAVGARPLEGRRPVVLLSHGTGGSALQWMWLAEPLVRAGYIVVAVDHHGNTSGRGVMSPAGFILWWERAKDVSVALDALLRDPAWSARIDPTRIAVAGFSLGGYTALLLAGARTDLARFDQFCASPRRDATCDVAPELAGGEAAVAPKLADARVVASRARAGDSYRDPRVRFAIAVAPAVVQALTPESLRAPAAPVAVVAGLADDIAPPSTNAEVAAALAGAPLLRIEGARHYDFLALCTDEGRARLGPLCAETQPGARESAHARVASWTLNLLRKHLGAVEAR